MKILRLREVVPAFALFLSLACSGAASGQEPTTGLNTASSQPVYTWRLRDSDGAVLREFKSEFNGSTEEFTWQRDFIHGADRLLASQGDGSTPALGLIAYHTDHLGTPRFISDILGGFVSEHHYHPFGEEITEWADGIPLKFTGHERDFADLDYMRARYYRPSLGRFLSADRQQDGWNLYAYASNNPVNRNDPSGLTDEQAQDSPPYEGPTISAYEADLITEALEFLLGANLYEIEHNLPVQLPSGEYERARIAAGMNLLAWLLPVKAGSANVLTKGSTSFAGATARQSPTVFSHFIPARIGRGLIERYGKDSALGRLGSWITGKSSWNGQYVSRAFHAATDPFATLKGVPRGSTTLPRPLNWGLRLPVAVQGWLANLGFRSGVEATDED